jgi:hypothetical protein
MPNAFENLIRVDEGCVGFMLFCFVGSCQCTSHLFIHILYSLLISRSLMMTSTSDCLQVQHMPMLRYPMLGLLEAMRVFDTSVHAFNSARPDSPGHASPSPSYVVHLVKLPYPGTEM